MTKPFVLYIVGFGFSFFFFFFLVLLSRDSTMILGGIISCAICDDVSSVTNVTKLGYLELLSGGFVYIYYIHV